MFSYCAFGQYIKTSSTKIELKIKDLIKPATEVELTHAVHYRNEFYCFFKEVLKNNDRREINFCFAFSNDGKNLRKIEIPKDFVSSIYHDFFVKNDTLYLKSYMEGESYFFNIEKYKWVKTKTIDDLIFEDEMYSVFALDFGEWGGKTWFKDKKTSVEYEIELSSPIINKIDSTYYISGRNFVYKIDKPKLLNECDEEVTYKNIEKNGKYTTWYGKSIGYERIYKDTTEQNIFDNQFIPHIVSSFVWQNELLHIYVTKTETFVARIDKNAIIPIQTIGTKQRFFNWVNSYRCKIQKDGSQLLKFRSQNKFGLITLNGENIDTYYLIFK